MDRDRESTTQQQPEGRSGLRAKLGVAREQFLATSDILRALASSSAAPDTVLDAVVENARRLLSADVAQIHVVTDDHYTLRWSSGLSHEYVAAVDRFPIKRTRGTLIGRVSLDGIAQQITDVLADPEYAQFELQRLGGYRSILGAPMFVDDHQLGVITVWRTEVRPFDSAEQAALTSFAAQAALALRLVDLYAALESRSAELAHKVGQLEALAEVGEAVSSTLDPDEVLTTIVSHAVQLSGTDGGSIMEYDDDARAFRVRTAYGTDASVVSALRRASLHIDRTWVGLAARTREVHQIHDLDAVELDPHLRILHQGGWRSLVVIPLVRPDRVVGALVVRRKVPGAFSEETCELLTAFANQSVVALTNARIYQQLERQSVELASASRHKSEFLASMSHELRTPLNAIIGFSEVLLERMFGDLNERQAEYLDDIHSAGRHLLALLNDVLDLSKIEAGRMELDVSGFDLVDALTQGLALVRERATLHGIRLSLTAEPDIGAVRADELRIKQVVLNLVSNAVKFTPDGGEVEVLARREVNDVVVSVRDTGVGIDPADQERIFDSFQQGERSPTSTEGTGLGLTLTRRIVELHGGEVGLVSEPGRGSTFTFTIPQGRRPEDATLGRDGGTVRGIVVVIEDDPRSAELVRLHLEATGLRVITVPTGEEGLVAVRGAHPDAVVLDIHLPGIDGWEVLGDLKSDAATAAVPVVVVSVEPERGRGFALGAADYLTKPVGGDRLLAALERALAGSPAGTGGRPRGDGEPDEAFGEAPLSVVVVDDDPAALALVRATLEPRGWVVHTCDGGVGAATVVRSVSPSVVLVDLLMPEVDGFAVIDELGGLPAHLRPPIVVLTAKSLTPADRLRLQGRIAFVAEKAALDLAELAQRLAEVAARPRREAAP